MPESDATERADPGGRWIWHASVRMRENLRIQLWSYNYDPEPTGIGPVSMVWAHSMQALGHEVDVVAAHPHYPEPRWGRRLRPYRELRDGVSVRRLPLWIGRETAMERYRQELSFMTAQTLAIPFLGRPDVRVVISPSFPALLPAILAGGAARVPWVLWLHDILPDGAAASGVVDSGSPVLRCSRQLERAAYRAADRIIVLSRAFTPNLVAKHVPEEKIELIRVPATRTPSREPAARPVSGPTALRVLSMGNIGFSQGLAELIGAFEDDTGHNSHVDIVITGSGMEADAVRARLRTPRVRMLGVVDDATLEHELLRADIGLVTQRPLSGEFNIPSKIMNFMTYGLPVIAVVDPAGEVARLVEESGGGWVIDSRDPSELPQAVAAIAADRDEIARRAALALAFARANFTREGVARRFDVLLRDVVEEQRRPVAA